MSGRLRRGDAMVVAALLAAFGPGAGADVRQKRVIYSTLSFADEVTYDTGNGNCRGGQGVFGFQNDLELCDDFGTNENFIITGLTGDFLSFLGQKPATGVQVQIWNKIGRDPPGMILVEWLIPPEMVTLTEWADPIYGLRGVRLDIEIPNDWIVLSPWTPYYLSFKPIDLTPTSDWYYQVADLDSQIGADRYMRQGDYDVGYGIGYEWKAAERVGQGRGDVGMEIRGIPSPGAAIVVGAWGLALGGRRRVIVSHRAGR